jgi:hypothetical protein
VGLWPARGIENHPRRHSATRRLKALGRRAKAGVRVAGFPPFGKLRGGFSRK